jgi:acyl dehydratase
VSAAADLLRVGERARRRRVFSQEDVAEYRALTGDAGLRYGSGAGGTVPGPLLAGMISDLLGTALPGVGTMWLKQSIRYPGSARIGEEVEAEVVITGLRPDKGLVDLDTTCRVTAGGVLEGRALVLVPDLASGAKGAS